MRKILLVTAATALVAALAQPANAQTPPDPASAKARVDTLRADLDKATKAYVQARDALEAVSAKVDHAQRQLDRYGARIEQAEAILNQQAVTAYRHGGLSSMSVLVSQGPEHAADRIEMVTMLASRQQRAISDARAVTASYNRAHDQLSAAQEQRKTLTAKRQAAVATLNTKLEAAQALYEREQAEARKLEQSQLVAAQGAESGAAEPSEETAEVSGNLACPVEAPYSYVDSWGAPRGGGTRGHEGTDIMAAHGQTVFAYTDGEVFRTSVNSGLGGNSVWLRDAEGIEYYYAHLASISVEEGEEVEAGEVIGTNGSSGNATADAPHVHFQVHPGGGYPVNPYPYVERACG